MPIEQNGILEPYEVKVSRTVREGGKLERAYLPTQDNENQATIATFSIVISMSV